MAKQRNLILQILDILALLLGFLIAYIVRFNSSVAGILEYDKFLLALVVIKTLSFYFFEPYEEMFKRGYLLELINTLLFVFANFIILTALLFLFKLSSNYSRIFICLIYVFYFIFSYIFRIVYKVVSKALGKKALYSGNKSLLIICESKNLKKIIDYIQDHNFDFYYINGFCVIDEDLKGEVIDGLKVVTNRDELLSYVCHEWIDDVFIDISYNKVPKDIIDGLTIAGISLHIKLSKINGIDGRNNFVNSLYGQRVLSSEIKCRHNYEVFLKRLIDVVGSIVGMFFTFILMIIIGPIIYMKSPGPIFYKQKRIGKNGKIFEMYKFRSMVINADELKEQLMSQNRIKDGMMFKVENDPRIIPGIGEFIRNRSLDEFPQFINVFKGDMSLVGTRPPTLDEWNKYGLEHRIRMAIKPGITGMWQTSGRSEITDFNKVVELDRDYINNWSLSLDIKLIFKTFISLFQKRKDAM